MPSIVERSSSSFSLSSSDRCKRTSRFPKVKPWAVFYSPPLARWAATPSASELFPLFYPASWINRLGWWCRRCLGSRWNGRKLRFRCSGRLWGRRGHRLRPRMRICVSPWRRCRRRRRQQSGIDGRRGIGLLDWWFFVWRSAWLREQRDLGIGGREG